MAPGLRECCLPISSVDAELGLADRSPAGDRGAFAAFAGMTKFADVLFAYDGAYRLPATLSLGQRAAYGLRGKPCKAAALSAARPVVDKTPAAGCRSQARSVQAPSGACTHEPPSKASRAARRHGRLVLALSPAFVQCLHRRAGTPAQPAVKLPAKAPFRMRVSAGRTVLYCVAWRGRVDVAIRALANLAAWMPQKAVT